jgi:hypothetical protein
MAKQLRQKLVSELFATEEEKLLFCAKIVEGSKKDLTKIKDIFTNPTDDEENGSVRIACITCKRD